MKLTYLGHAAFQVDTDAGLSIVLDPYRSGALGGRVAHGPIRAPADLVVVTHYHEDHGWIGGVPGSPTVVDGPGRFGGVDFRVAWIPHDDSGGDHMGLSRMMAFTVDGIGVLHPGDIGREPTHQELARLGRVDLLLLPVGGTFTLPIAQAEALRQRLKPRWTVPMHYDSNKVTLKMARRDAYLAVVDPTIVRSAAGHTLHCDPARRNEPAEVVLLDPLL